MVVRASLKNCFEKAPVPDVAVDEGDEEPITDVIIDVDEPRIDVEDSLMEDAADDCVDEVPVLVDVETAPSGSDASAASSVQAVALVGFVPTYEPILATTA